MQTESFRLPPSINFHLLRECNMCCRFCFAVFAETGVGHRKGWLQEHELLDIIGRVAACGVDKVTFAGGEPTLYRHLEAGVRAAKRAGLTTMIVTNGSRPLDWALGPECPLDWVAFSIDSADEARNIATGRALKGKKALRIDELLGQADRLRGAGVRIKLNTVVTSRNADEDLSDLVTRLAPERWKVLQVLPVDGQNDGRVEDLLVSAAAYRAFVARHRRKIPASTVLVAETNEDIRESYAMIDPAGRFFDNATGRLRYSRPILEVGVAAAWNEVAFSAAKYDRRGARYSWGRSVVPLGPAHRPPVRFVALAGVSGSGKDTAAEALVEAGYTRIAVIDPLKRALQNALDLSDAQLWGDQRNTPIAGVGCSARRLFQIVSDVVRHLQPDFWIRRWHEAVENAMAGGGRVVCTDLRTRDELAIANELGALVVRVKRTGAGAPAREASHATETELTELADSAFDEVLENDGSIPELHARVRTLARLG